jgi:hypothetical protein
MSKSESTLLNVNLAPFLKKQPRNMLTMKNKKNHDYKYNKKDIFIDNYKFIC